MKFFKYLAILLALLAAGFFAIGALNPQFDYRTQVEIAKAPAAAWDTVMNIDSMSSWITGFERMDVLSGEAGEVGTVYMLYFRENGRVMTVKETATIMEEGKRYGFDMDSEWFSGSSLITIEPVDAGSRLTIDNTVSGKGTFKRSMLFLMRSTMRDRQQSDIEKLRDLIESV